MNTDRGSPGTPAESLLDCPFVYASGKKCTGRVSGWKIYGPPERAHKVRLWCSDKWDHAGNKRIARQGPDGVLPRQTAGANLRSSVRATYAVAARALSVAITRPP